MIRHFKRVLVLGLVFAVTSCDVLEPPGEVEVEIIARGAIISGANGIEFAPNGDLYIASVIGNEVIIMDPQTGAIKERMPVDGPDDIAFNAAGDFYWTSILTGEVAGMRADGTRVSVANLGPGVNPITFSDDGRLFVSQCFFGDKLFEVDPEGNTEPTLISDQLGPGCGLNGMDWGPDGRLYGPRWFTGAVVSFDVDDHSMRVEVEGLTVPAAVKFDSTGKLHVLDTARGRIIAIEDGQETTVVQLTPGLDNFAFDADDRLFVSSFTDGFIIRVDDNGELIQLAPGGLAHPGGITRRSNGELVVADLHAIRGFDPLTGENTFTQRNVLGVGTLGTTLNLSADGDNLIMVSWVDANVRIWNPEQQVSIAKFDGLNQPVSALRYGDNLLVTEQGLGRITLLADGKATSWLEGLTTPTGLAVFEDRLYVTDWLSGTILKIGAKNQALDNPEVMVSGLTNPEGLVVDANGFVVVEGSVGRVKTIQPDGTGASVIAEFTPGSAAASPAQPLSMVFNGLVAGDKGTLFVTSEADRTLIRITP